MMGKQARNPDLCYTEQINHLWIFLAEGTDPFFKSQVKKESGLRNDNFIYKMYELFYWQ